ncbi:hypothetical protein WDL1P1_00294 (plasmid) [Variovorax sp. WDL1]|nr:hypothetical protein WDL1P1_00294 [Variovorax sp. WDL1]
MPDALLQSLDSRTAAAVRGLLGLVDTYADTRHSCGAPEYNARAAEARKRLIAGLVAELPALHPCAQQGAPSAPAFVAQGRPTPPSPRGFSCD